MSQQPFRLGSQVGPTRKQSLSKRLLGQDNSTLNSLASSLLQGGQFLGDTVLSAVSKPYAEDLMARNKMARDDETRVRSQAFNEGVLGQSPQFDPITRELSGDTGMHQFPGSGMLGGNMSDLEYLSQMQGSPNPAMRTAAAGAIRDQMQPSENGAVNFNQYSQFDEGQRADFDQFKGRTPAAMTVKERSGIENTLRDDFRTETKDFSTIKSSYDRIQGAQKGGIGDIALIFSYMKMLDPASTVREGEAASVANAAGVPAQISQLYNKALSGALLDPSVRNDIRSQTGVFYDQAAKTNSTRRARYINTANDYGVNSLNVVGGEANKRGGPKVGDRRINPDTGRVQVWTGD